MGTLVLVTMAPLVLVTVAPFVFVTMGTLVLVTMVFGVVMSVMGGRLHMFVNGLFVNSSSRTLVKGLVCEQACEWCLYVFT